MPSDIEHLLHQAAGPLPTEAPEAQILRRAASRRRRRRLSQVALTVAMLAGVSFAGLNLLQRPSVEFSPADQPADYSPSWCAQALGDAPGADDPGCSILVDRVNNYRVLVPDGWHTLMARDPAFTTGFPRSNCPGRKCVSKRYVSGKSGKECRVPFPSLMGEHGVTVAVLSGTEAPGVKFPPRPASFTFARGEAAPPFGKPCAFPPGSTTSWFTFRDGGRNFHAVVAVGPQASADRRRAALRVLNSFKVLRPSGPG